MNEIKNYGVIMGEYSPTTFVGGTIPYEVRNPSGDWTPYLPVGEKQAGKEDWMDCVTRSLTNTVEIQEKQQTGQESNYCDREVARGSGTTRQGNNLDRVAEYARTTGLGQQATYPDSGGTFDEQNAPVPTNIRLKLDAEKKGWLSRWDIKYEVIPHDKKSLQYHLKHAPLQVVIPGHAIVNITSNYLVDVIFDSYSPFIKNVPGPQYPGSIIYAMKVVLYKKENSLDPDSLFTDLKLGDTGTQVLKLKRALGRLGWFSNDTNIYDDRTADTVSKYKLANLDLGAWGRFWERYLYRGNVVDSRTRESINNNLTKRK